MAKTDKDDEPKSKYRIRLSPKQRLEVSIFESAKGDVVLNFRKFYMDKDEEWKPDRQGMSMPIDKVKALKKAVTLLNDNQHLAEPLPKSKK